MVRSWLSRVDATGIFQRLSVGSGAFRVSLVGIIIGGTLVAFSLYLACELLDPGVLGGLTRGCCVSLRGTARLALSFIGRLPRCMDRLLRVLFGCFCVGGGALAPVGGRGGGPVLVSVLSLSSTVARFLRMRVRSRASAQRER